MSPIRNQIHWLNAFQVLLENHNDYKKYLSGSLPAAERTEFFNKFTPIFARASKRGVGDVDATKANENGYSGTEKFLHGRNQNIENWIKKCLGTA